MVWGSNQIKFDKDYLKELTNDPDSGVFRQQCKYHVALHPVQFNDFGQSVKDELGRKIARFDELFEGIMLGYENVTLESKLGVIGLDNCYVHLDIQAFFFVFRPEVGMILKGKVTRTTKDHVGCLVYNTFNISIPRPDNDDEDKKWLGQTVTLNSEVEFKIIYVDLSARLPHIRGELRSILSEGIETKSKKKNRKIRFDSVDDIEIKTEPIEEDTPKKKHKDQEVTKKSKKKKSKKDKDIDVSLESLDIKSLFTDTTMDFDMNPPERKTKKRRSKSSSQDIYLDEIKLEADSDLERIVGDKEGGR